MKTTFTLALTRVLMLVALIAVIIGLTVPTLASPRPAVPTNAAPQNQRSIGGRVIPTTTNPTGSGTTASRTYANTSFEQTDYQCGTLPNGWAAIGMDKMRGWYSSHSPAGETNCPGYTRTGQRVIELQKSGLNVGNDPYDGLLFAELSAFERMYIYQPLCMQSGEEIDFKFHHKPLTGSRSDIMVLRFGVPSGLPAGAVAADTYDRPVMYAKTTAAANRLANAAVHTGFTFDGVSYTTPSGTTSPASFVTAINGWAEYSGTHTLPSTGWDGIYNLGFYGIDSDSPNGGNLLDGIEIALSAMVDLGASRDTSAGEQSTPTALKIRINGRVPSGAKIALKAVSGDATPDSDYSIGTVSAGAFGSVTTTHTAGSSVWVFDIPAGDYDGGVVPANNKGGLTIPITYSYDLVPEGTEHVKFVVSDPGADGGTANWAKGDPTCDGSEKNDGVVYSITNVNPTATPTLTPSNTRTPTATPTPEGQFITFPAQSVRSVGEDDFLPGATASSGRPVTYVSDTPSVCTIVDGKVRIISGGDCTITASSSAGGGFSAAPPVSRTFKVRKPQVITFPPVAGKQYTSPAFEIGASAESGLTITYISETPTICEIVGTKVRLLAEGVCKVTANQSGGTNGGSVWEPAAPVTRSFNSLGLLQTITVSPDLSKRIYDPEFDISAVSDSTLPVAVVSNTPTICTIVGTKVKLLSGGRCVLRASQPGGNVDGLMYAAAENKFIRIDVNGATATLTRTPTRTMTPTPIPNLLKKAAVGSSFVLGLLQNGTLVTWGMNKEFQTNIPPCCANSITDVAVGTNFALALKGGRVYAWGANTRGQLKIPTAAQSNVTAIAAGYAHGLALKRDGSIVCWGNNLNKQCNAPKGLKGVKAIAGGSEHTLAITKDNKVLGWGLNTVSQVKIPPTAVGVTAISAGCDHNLAIKNDGSVIAWGGNKYRQSNVPTNLKDAKSVGAGCHYSMALTQDGTIFGWGRNEFNQATAPVGITNAFSIGVGYVNSIISLRDGSVISIGAPDHGALTTRTPSPRP